MYRKVMALCLTVFLVSIAIAAHAEEISPKREVSERFIVQIDSSSWVKESFKVSPDSKRVAYGAIVGDKWFMVVDGKEEKKYDDIGEGSPIFSPDSKRVAYVAGEGGKWFVVVDGKEGKKNYDFIGGHLFSPDCKHVAYAAEAGDKKFVVVDGKEGNKYDYIVAIAGGWIGGWISPDSLHYLIIKGSSSIYLVEERIR
jgi:hypothetical protein